ncbi:ABC transporter ATP-binding protein [Sneathiella sp.]|uniref:ABC transporter ATP-binding protein n=1 Tax=Sneathiella sp. TaxID=1964365 RepID=UPI002624467B|nr:ABC transporter ATP-binding protein [Sneathiella sp.]MDF2367404.1 ABC transporter ATP-binding protein [Sneathiella sp.]
MPQKPIIKLSDIHLTLKSDAGPVNILRGIDLTVQQGETVGIVGPSGSGKSTLMSIMAGLELPTSGSVEIAEQKLENLNEDALARFRRANVGIVFQSFHLIPTMTALENVAIPLELAGEKDAFSVAEARLEAVGLADRATHYPAQLSGGEQQRVALARALSTNPKILLADEPTGNLDGKTGELIVELMFQLHEKEGTTMVLITHDDALARKCTHQVRLEDGRVVSRETGREEVLAGE